MKTPKFNVNDQVFCLDRGKIIECRVVLVEHNEFLEYDQYDDFGKVIGTAEKIIIETTYGLRHIPPASSKRPSDHDFQRDADLVFASREELIKSL